MPKTIQFIIPGEIHCIDISCGFKQSKLFISLNDYLDFKTIVLKQSLTFNISMLGYCLTPQRVLILAQPHAELELSKMLQSLQILYQTRALKKGHPLRLVYKYTPIESSFVKKALRYIERSPIGDKLALYPEHYLWSSCIHSIGVRQDPLIKALPAHPIKPKPWHTFVSNPTDTFTTMVMKNILRL